MLLTAIIIRLESPGPVIYSQDRVGLHEKEFTVYKFRSMRNDAEKNGAVWACANHSRVTRFGRFIRKVRIDELPQVWNILKGDMSFIGPRPWIPEYYEWFTDEQKRRVSVTPGISGLAERRTFIIAFTFLSAGTYNEATSISSSFCSISVLYP